MLGERLKKCRKHKGYNLDDFAKEMNIAKRTLQNYEKDVSEPSVKFASKVATFCQINEYWLMTGNGEMEDSNILPTVENSLDDNDVVTLNFYPEVYAAAGYGATNTDMVPNAVKINKQFLEQLIEIRNYDQLDIIRVYGESMEPYISNGEFVIIEKNNEAKNGETVIANINGEVYIKKYKADPFKQWIKLISENGSYDEIHIEGQNLELLNIVGIVRAKIKPF